MIRLFNNKNRKKSKTQKGFTLIEVLVSIFIFVLVIVSSSSIFSSIVVNTKNAKDIQKGIENAQFILNTISKTLRTSEVIEYTSSHITVYDFSRSSNSCIDYSFDSGGGLVKIGTLTVADRSNCSKSAVDSTGNIRNLVDDKVGDMRFLVLESTDDPDPAVSTVGRVLLSALVCKGDDCSFSAGSVVQTTVSLRN